MNRLYKSSLMALVVVLAGAMTCFADPIITSLTGSFADPNEVFLYNLSLPIDSDVAIQSWGYGGGTNGAGVMIPSGGFDPIIALFDSTGSLFDQNDDGSCPPGNSAEGCFDPTLNLFLTAGNYTVALSAFFNFPNGPTLADGFFGLGDFNARTGNWAFDVAVSPVPEPATLFLLGTGLASLASLKRKRTK